jgi:predicted nucleic acid-binding protein
MRFVDTNVLLYSVSTDPHETEKAATAARVLEAPDLALSVQVLQEFLVQATRGGRSRSLSPDEAHGFISTWLRYPVQETTTELMRRAIIASGRWQISYWDAAVVEAAKLLGCSELLTEDLNEGQDFAGVRVVNPFRA